MRKTLISILALSFFTLISQFSLAQEDSLNEEKATLYITRTSAIGMAMKFRFFVGNEFIGSFTHGKYLKVEVDPGKEIIMGHGENYSFVEANFEGGKTYVVDATPKIGALSAAIKLRPVTDNSKFKKRVLKYLANKKQKIISDEDLHKMDKDHVLRRGEEVYKKLKKKNSKRIVKLTSNITL